MANSNENTQNPKENQEKMADEGIQEHSEHTAENKQPESKDDVQNTDESTCLCKFFKKITEWMCASENKNSNKADENAAENNDAAKQEEMKQADTVEQPKEQRKLSDYLKIISKLLGIFSVYGIFIGGITIYSYLLNIGQLSIFPDVIANAANLLTISISFGIIFLIIYALLYFIFCLANPEGIKNDIPSYKLEGWSIIIVLFAIIYLILIFLNIISFSFSNFVVFCFIAFLFSLIAYLSSKVLKKIFFIACLPVNAFIILILMFYSEKAKVLYPIHYVEFRSDSSWYLLHNNFQQNNGSQEANGIDKNDLLKLKQKFKCSALSETEKKEKDIDCSPHFEQRNNALFGYMAWNLGDTKVFCPPTVDNTLTVDDTKEEQQKERNRKKEQLRKECIVISGKALQIMPESYISTDTDGNDDSNPDNTGHDNPAIDINTDVRFKNDLNAQSNAGLNNFNVQPILPIQSNAKNMSIQIHYGSCNHDSPRNKDGHPDIGYTDKKICQ
ncbi:EpsG family protein [Neisseria sp. HMSC064D07]|jgi:hypothetical protein|uniref:EpsG family protein n=1 Tax=Neisseria sp. HMSC064D07 TaxID=1715087 RepID=UPI0008AA2D80|nr:EpsG family protein [Neisseria sp. HMSC064D07]OHQ05170.1 hypothetical protein HMPREF2608_10010 [Neisseria sp. HMSC064D07]